MALATEGADDDGALIDAELERDPTDIGQRRAAVGPGVPAGGRGQGRGLAPADRGRRPPPGHPAGHRRRLPCHRPGRAAAPLRRALLRQHRPVLGGTDPRRGAEPHPRPVPEHADRPGGARRHRPGPGRRGSRRPRPRASCSRPRTAWPGPSGPAPPTSGIDPPLRVAPGPIAPVRRRSHRRRRRRAGEPEEAEALVWTDPTDAKGSGGAAGRAARRAVGPAAVRRRRPLRRPVRRRPRRGRAPRAPTPSRWPSTPWPWAWPGCGNSRAGRGPATGASRAVCAWPAPA